MNLKEKVFFRKVISLVSAIMLSVCTLAVSPTAFVHASESTTLSNPVIQDNGVVAWDTVYFGIYPQSSDGNGGFVVEPIQWRVLQVDGDHAYLMSEKLIDCMPFCETDGRLDCLYEQSTIRCWLNGYDASQNMKKIDYTENNFIDKAFTKEEQDAIEVTHVINDESMAWAQYYDKNHFDTDDKIFLITRRETTTYEFMSYGFVKPTDEEDEEGFCSELSATRVAYATDYAVAGGSHGPEYAEYVVPGANPWNLRSPGEYPMYNGFINNQGEYNDIQVDSNMLNTPSNCTRPCLYLDLTKTDVYSYAGKVYAKDEVTITGTANYVKTVGDPDFSLKLKQTGDAPMSYTSSDEQVATVDADGKVTIVGAGSVVITATTAENDRYLSASRTVKITVKEPVIVVPDPEPVAQTITGANVTKTYGNSAFSLGAKAETTLTYKSDNTKVCTVSSTGKVTIKGAGIAKITVTAAAENNYLAATKTLTVTVNPAKVSVDKLKASKKALTVTWKKRAEATGYKVQYATSSKFSSAKTVSITKNSTLTKTIKSLKSGKKYYVRVRAYKKVGTKYLYGAYSTVKSITVK